MAVIRFLLDTNAIAEAARPTPNPGFLKRMMANEASLAIASVTLHEAVYGVERMPEGRRKQLLRDYLSVSALVDGGLSKLVEGRQAAFV